MADDDSSVRVAVRIRPQIAREVIDMCRVCTAVTPGEPQVTLGSDKAFTYDYVFNMDADQESLYHTCVGPLVDGSLDGYNATVLAYGQTGSGKTYTMGTGFDVALPDEQVGIIPRAIRHLFDGIKQRANSAVEAGDPAPEFSVVAQFMELYNEEVIDLFDPVRESAALKGAALGNGPALAPAVAVMPPQGHHKIGGGIRIHEDALGGIYVVGVTMRAVRSAEEALQCLRLGALSRTTASTQMNTQSSRSHAIFTLHVKQQRMVRETNENDANGELGVDVVSGNQPTKEFETLTAKFHFVDLAGSERLKRTGATGERAREGISINCGLLALGNVISALGDKSKRALHVPYRDSKLTRLLQDSLGGNSRTVMIACVSPSDRDFMETLNTLKYANRARNIKNRVTINQDKSSRTICLLRQEIQLLQLELMEYKQGKRVVGEDGTETVNDMFYENNMLQNENNNLRMRIKAMQETIDTLSSRNTQILAEKAAGSWINSGADSDVSEMIQGYVKEIEELRAKLLESEFTCQQLRKNAANVRSPTSGARNFGASPHVAMSGGYDISFGEMPSVGELLEKAKMEVKRDMQQLKQQYKSKRSRSVGVGAGGDEDGGEESGRNGMGEDGSEEKGAVEERGEDGEVEEDGEKVEGESGESDSEERGGGDESESETDSEEKEEGETPEEVNAQYGMELAELTSEINIKQKLIEELELSQRRLQSMRAHYEDKLTQLQRRIQDTQDERDKVLASITGAAASNQSLSLGSAGADKIKKVKEDYEKRLTEMKKELQRLQAAKKEHARLLRNQTHYETQMRQLRTDLTEMKRAKVKLVNKMKEELTRHKESDLRRAKEIAQLRKETRRNENKIRSLEADKRAKEAVLKRRNEEVSALRKQRAARGATGVLSARAAGHLRVKNGMRRKLSEALLDGGVVREVGEGDWKFLDILAVPEKNFTFVVLPVTSTAKSFSPKAAKQKWQAMEKSITQIALGKQAVSALEMDMERLLQRRDHLGHSLEHALRKHNQAVMVHNTDESVLTDLDEQIEALRANIDYVQESIKECQTNIMQMEVAKEEAAPADVVTFVSSLQDLDEARYIIEKLFNMTVNQTCNVSQKEANIKEMEAQLTQEKKTSAVQNELLQHVLTQEQWDVFARLEGIESGTGDDKEGTSPTYSSNASSRSASPERAVNNPSFSVMGPPPPPSNISVGTKARRRTAMPSELLYPNQNRGEAREVSGEDSESGDMKSVSEDDASQKGSLTRVPSAPGSLKTLGNRVGGIGVGDGGQSATVAQPRPSPFLGRRTYDQTQAQAHLSTTSPRLARRNLGPSMTASANASSMPAGSGGYSSLGGRPGSMEQGLDSTPPNSPPGYRRQISREENVFSRLTSGTTVGSEHLPGQGVITLYQGRATPKAPLICTHIAEGHSKPVLSVCATDDLLFTASKDRTVKVWDLSRGEEIESLAGHPNNVVVVRYNEPNRLVFSVSSAYVKVWDLRLSPQARCIKTLLSSGIGQNGPVVLNTPSRTLSLPVGEVHLNDVALNPNGTTLYTAGGDKVRVWDLRKFAATAKLTGGHQAAIMCLAVGKISEEEDIVVTGSKDHYIKVFEVSSRGNMNNYNPKVNLEPPHYDGIQALALHGDMLFSGSRDMAIKKWDLSKEELVQSVNNAHKDWVCGLTFMPGGGGQMLLSGCRSGVVRLWSSETCHLLGEMQAHSSPINALATNSSHVFTACNTGEVKVWKSPQYNAMTMSTGRVFELSL